MAGRPSRNENRAASARLRSRNSAAVSVDPERGHAGDQRADLGDADHHRVEQRDVGQHPPVLAVEFRNGQQHAHDDAGDPDHGQAAQRGAAGIKPG